MKFDIKYTVSLNISTPQNEIVGYKTSKMYIRFAWGKLQDSDEKNKRRAK